MKSLVIEASAGTGKTYSIENKTIDLIWEGIPLPEILIMTFTEQATSELRKRIRGRIQSFLSDNKLATEKRGLLQKALNEFELASILTIHGFCNQLLNAYAFETGMPFHIELIDNHSVLPNLFTAQLRNVWADRIVSEQSARMQNTLHRSNFERDIILRLTEKYQYGDQLIVSSLSDTIQVMANMQTWLNEDLVNEIRLNKGKAHAGTVKAVLQRLEGLKDALATFEINSIGTLIKEILDHPNWVSFLTDPPIQYISPEQWQALDDLHQRLKGNQHSEFIQYAVHSLRRTLEREKRKRAVIDYTDMLESVRRALKGSSMLGAILRGRYRAALVDEFQDTDPIQWDIIRRIFAMDDDHSLILVGDPKQSIYGFRGSNVQTYLAAKDELHNKGALREELNTNFRSVPGLLDRFNALFGEGWFASSEMAYTPVLSPSSIVIPPPFQVRADHSGREPLTSVEIRSNTVSKARRLWSEWIAEEIAHLLESGISYANGQNMHEFDPGDIAILVRNRSSDLDAVRRALRKRNIPYTIGRMTGLFQSDEAVHIQMLLRFLANPHDRNFYRIALFSRFFNIRIVDYQKFLNLPEDHPIPFHSKEWREIAERRDWGNFFRSIFRDTNLLARELMQEDGERRITNFMHIAQILTEDAMRQNLDMTTLEKKLNEYRHRDFPDDDPKDLQRLETEQRKVNILTLHGSKGLQFPIVFIAGSIGGFIKRTPPYLSYIERDKRIFDFTLKQESEEKQNRQENAETERLFYVGLTRAQHKVYLPVWRGEEGSNVKRNYIAELIDKRISALGWNILTPLEKETEASIAETPDQSPELQPTPHSLKNLRYDVFLNAVIPDARERVISVSSFSHLASVIGENEIPTPIYEIMDSTQLSIEPSDIVTGLRDVRDEFDREEPPEAREEDTLPPLELPKGKRTGNALHSILQHIDFQHNSMSPAGDENDESAIRLIRRMAQSENFSERYDTLFRERIWHTLGASLPQSMGGCAIGEIRERVHEMPFWIPFPEMRKLRIPGVTGNQSYLTGFIDMLAKINGRYYIFDWKSNYSAKGYAHEALAEIMREHRYLLQGRIYTHAIRKWLASFLPNFSYDTDFGGVCYVFLRGVQRNTSAGLYFWRDEEPLIANLDAVLTS